MNIETLYAATSGVLVDVLTGALLVALQVPISSIRCIIGTANSSHNTIRTSTSKNINANYKYKDTNAANTN